MPKRNSIPTEPQLAIAITRVFDAPRSLLFKMWIEGKHLANWSAPRGFTIPTAKSDVRPGGAWRCCMRSPDGVDYWVGGVYREIVEPERLVFTHAELGARNAGHRYFRRGTRQDPDDISPNRLRLHAVA